MFIHGPTSCDRCWTKDECLQERGSFRLVRDPGYWGSSNPELLVLGISKGNTQSDAMGRQRFEDVAFKGIRERLLTILQSVGLIGNLSQAEFEKEFTSDARLIGFASVVRCSITGWNEQTGKFTAESKCVSPAFRPISDGYRFAHNCIDTQIKSLPSKTGKVILLGNTPSYISAVRKAIAAVRREVKVINEVAYSSHGVRFVHVTHPSGLNGHFGAYVRGEGSTGRKRNLAKAALRQETRC